MGAAKKCAKCGKDEPGSTPDGARPFMVCGRCRGVHYCSRACQKDHWKSHKKACKETVSETSKVKTDTNADKAINDWLIRNGETLGGLAFFGAWDTDTVVAATKHLSIELSVQSKQQGDHELVAVSLTKASIVDNTEPRVKSMIESVPAMAVRVRECASKNAEAAAKGRMHVFVVIDIEGKADPLFCSIAVQPQVRADPAAFDALFDLMKGGGSANFVMSSLMASHPEACGRWVENIIPEKSAEAMMGSIAHALTRK